MTPVVCLLAASVWFSMVWPGYARSGKEDDNCLPVSAVDKSLSEINCLQPFYLTLLTKTEENQLFDNVCVTFFPLPDDPDTFQLYTSRVYCDGSHEIISTIATQISTGVYRRSNPFSTVTQHIFGYAGCETFLVYTCREFGEPFEPFVFGASVNCKPTPLSCLRKVEEIISSNGLPEVELYVLPMKLPNRCVTQQLCVTPPNPFYNKLH